MQTTETPRNYTTEFETRLYVERDQIEKHIDFVCEQRDILERLNVKLNTFTDHVDFESLTRPDVLRVIKAFPGRWEKSKGYDGKINYTRIEPCNGLILRLWGAEAPSCCHIEETIEYIEVPARTERRVTRVVKCPEPIEE